MIKYASVVLPFSKGRIAAIARWKPTSRGTLHRQDQDQDQNKDRDQDRNKDQDQDEDQDQDQDDGQDQDQDRLLLRRHNGMLRRFSTLLRRNTGAPTNFAFVKLWPSPCVVA